MSGSLFYDQRPRLADFAQVDEDAGAHGPWQVVRSAGILLSELLLFYPGHRLVFLGRDLEYHHDIAQVLLRGSPAIAANLGVVNISRAALASPHWRAYAEQRLFQGPAAGERPLVLIDSGFNGNVIKAVQAAFPERLVHGHLLCSENPEFPMSHAALALLGVGWDDDRHQRKRRVEQAIEHLPHFTAKARDYLLSEGTWQAVCDADDDLHPWQVQAMALMRQLRACAERWRRPWAEAHAPLSSLVEALTCVPARPQRLVLDGRLLAGPGPDPVDIADCAGLPLGGADLLRELACRQRGGLVTVAFRAAAGERQRLEQRLRLLRHRGSPLAVHGFQVLAPEDEGGGLELPEGDLQKGASAVLQRIDQPPGEDRPVPWRALLRTVASIPGGNGVLRDLLEEAPRQRLGIFLRPERVGHVWSRLLRG